MTVTFCTEKNCFAGKDTKDRRACQQVSRTEQAVFRLNRINREPYLHLFDAKRNETRVIFPASGVVTAIDPVLRACGGTWVAHGSGNADRRFVNSRNKLGVPLGDERYILKRVWLTKEEEEGYYYGFANEGLWPLCHVTHTRPIFRETDWQMYRKVNQIFAHKENSVHL